jgi:hypothetical protein
MRKLYPYLSEMIKHYQELANMKEEIEKIAYEDVNTIYDYLLEIIDFTMPQLEVKIKEGQKLYDIILENLSVEPVGIIPAYDNEGYALIKSGDEELLHSFRYVITNIFLEHEKYIAVNIEHQKTYEYPKKINIIRFIKDRIIRESKDVPNPMVLYIESRFEIPIQESLLPIVKRNICDWLYSIKNQ